jgi:hypothetical protein
MSAGVRGERMFKPQDRVLPLPVKRHLKVDFRDRQIHSSNPSLQFPSDMADYRLAAERLRQFGIRRNEQREDMSGFVTLKQFMLSRQEEERRQNSRAAHRPTGSSEGVFTNPQVQRLHSHFRYSSGRTRSVKRVNKERWYGD